MLQRCAKITTSVAKTAGMRYERGCDEGGHAEGEGGAAGIDARLTMRVVSSRTRNTTSTIEDRGHESEDHAGAGGDPLATVAAQKDRVGVAEQRRQPDDQRDPRREELRRQEGREEPLAHVADQDEDAGLGAEHAEDVGRADVARTVVAHVACPRTSGRSRPKGMDPMR